jgi:hypothetical protein
MKKNSRADKTVYGPYRERSIEVLFIRSVTRPSVAGWTTRSRLDYLTQSAMRIVPVSQGPDAEVVIRPEGGDEVAFRADRERVNP